MWVTRLLSLLLPLGIWLVQLGATPGNSITRQLIHDLLVISLSTLAFFTLGFGLLCGNLGTLYSQPELAHFTASLSVPVNGQNWNLLGLTGFGITSLSSQTALQLCITFLPLALSSALLVNNLFSTYLVSRTVSNATTVPQSVFILITAVLVAGILFPIAAFWLYGGGWLAKLGSNLNYGHGAIDVNGISTAALVAGGAGVAWLMMAPRQPATDQPELPQSHVAWLSRFGTVCIVMGAVFTSVGNPFVFALDNPNRTEALITLLIASGMAAMVAFIYTYLVEGRPNVNILARAILAAVVATSAGNSLLPNWTAGLLGLCAGLLVTLGLYMTNEVLGLADDTGILTSVALPALFGSVALGLFANGTLGQGLNGIGSANYLGVDGLGVVGMFSSVDVPGDVGQLTAQLVAAVTIPGLTLVAIAPIAWFMHVRLVVQQAERPTLQAPAPVIARPSLTPLAPDTLLSHITGIEFETRAPLPYVTQEQPYRSSMQGTTPEDKPPSKTPIAGVPVHRETLLERLRRTRGTRPEADASTKVRHAAAPFRVGGRRLSVRPMQSTKNKNAAEGGKPAN